MKQSNIELIVGEFDKFIEICITKHKPFGLGKPNTSSYRYSKQKSCKEKLIEAQLEAKKEGELILNKYNLSNEEYEKLNNVFWKLLENMPAKFRQQYFCQT